AEAVEVQLVEDHRMRRDGVEAPDGAAVVVLPAADDQLLGQALQLLRVATQWLMSYVMVIPSHQPPPVTPRIARSSKAVMESAFVHRPTRPDLNRGSRWSRYSVPLSHACM